MKTKLNTNTIIRIVTILLSIVILLGANKLITKGEKLFGRLSVAPVYPATVELILAKNWTDPEAKSELQVHFEGKITGGDKKGESVLGRQFVSSSYVANHKIIEQGDKVMVRYTDYGTENIWVFQQYNRAIYTAGLLAFFILLLFIFGGKKGFYTLLSLTFTFACLFLYFIPSILMGYNIYIAAFLTCIFIMLQTLILVNGVSDKTIAAAVGTMGGIVLSGIIFKIMDSLLQLTGIVDEEASFLLIMNSSIELKGIMFAATIISAVGASLDVGVSISSSLSEIYENKKGSSFRQVFTSGMNIGQDIISTMTNTLILVYVGSALSGTLLLVAYSNSFLELINREGIIFEIMQALIGSIGVLFAIPTTSAFYAFIMTLTPKEKQPKAELPQAAPITFELAEPKELVSTQVPKQFKK